MQSLPPYLVIMVSALAAIIFGWLEVKRRNRSRLGLRLAAVLIVVAALACIALPLKYNATQSVNQAQKHILLTSGFDNDSLPTDINNHIYTLDASVNKRFPKAKLLTGLDELPDLKLLHIYGDGLKPYQLEQLEGVPIAFHPSSKPHGVIAASWPEKVKDGDNLQVQGLYNNILNKKIKLTLKGSATALDSVTIEPRSEAKFNLSAKPKATGELVYQLYVDTALQGDVPVQVIPTKTLKVLMLSASPDFETKFLKNWLAGNGYAVAMRTVISKDKYNTEFINLPQPNINSLSATILNKFDVVIGDLSVLASLNPAEAAVLKQQINDGGLGVILRADSTDKKTWLQNGFAVDRPSGKEASPGFISIGTQKSRSGKLPVGAAYINHNNGTQALAKTGAKTVAAIAQAGAGKVVFNIVNNSYSWVLGGDKEDYAWYWSALISNAARKAEPDPLKITFSSLPVTGEPVKFNIDRGDSGPILINNERVAPEQSQSVPFLWFADGQTTAPGWQTLQSGGHSALWYAYPGDQWLGIQSAQKIAATTAYQSAHPILSDVTKQIQEKIRIDVPKIYFYMLLLAACTFLWIEAKL